MSNSKTTEAAKINRAESALAACLRGGRLSHAILVEGVAGTLDFAKKIAKAVVCESETDKPCGTCRQCLKSDKDIHPDILVYSGGERVRSFHVDSVRELRHEAYVRPNDAEAKAIILENVQNMTVQAQNALLKIIEEPPGAVVFILTCENKSVMLETILSRVSVFSLNDPALTHTASEPETSAFDETAKIVVENLMSGSELNALAAFAPYEKDRTGFGNLLAAIRRQAASELASIAKSGKGGRDKSKRLAKIIEIADELEVGLNQNVGGLLMSVLLPAKFKLPA